MGKTDFRLLALAVFLLTSSSVLTHKCTNEKGEKVDWYVSLRVPNSRTYLVYEPGMTGFRQADEKLLQKTTELLSFTKGKVMLWNDQTINKTASSSKAHAKGILHWDDETGGFLLIHSIPHFVDISDNIFKSTTRESSMYGQSMICVSLDRLAEVTTVIDHIMSQNANIYLNTFEGTSRPKPKVNKMVSYVPFGFKLVTKTSISDENPFEDLLSGEYNVGWLVNTWGRPYMQSACNGEYKVSNINFKSLNSVTMKYTQDHSKWALSYGDERRIVCIGDLNHMESQSDRGGSFLCIDHLNLYRAIYETLLNDDCQIVQNFHP